MVTQLCEGIQCLIGHTDQEISSSTKSHILTLAVCFVSKFYFIHVWMLHLHASVYCMLAMPTDA